MRTLIAILTVSLFLMNSAQVRLGPCSARFHQSKFRQTNQPGVLRTPVMPGLSFKHHEPAGDANQLARDTDKFAATPTNLPATPTHLPQHQRVCRLLHL